MAIKSNSVFWGGFCHILKKLLEISASELSTVDMRRNLQPLFDGQFNGVGKLCKFYCTVCSCPE